MLWHFFFFPYKWECFPLSWCLVPKQCYSVSSAVFSISSGVHQLYFCVPLNPRVHHGHSPLCVVKWSFLCFNPVNGKSSILYCFSTLWSFASKYFNTLFPNIRHGEKICSSFLHLSNNCPFIYLSIYPSIHPSIQSIKEWHKFSFIMIANTVHVSTKHK